LDPISLVLSAYLENVQNTVHSAMTDRIGTEVKAISIEYEGLTVPFQYQMWRIKDKSVCGVYSEDVLRYSECSIKAKKLFTSLCTQLGSSSQNEWRRSKLKNMYCNASVSYKPTVALISHGFDVGEIQEAKQKCNIATVKAMGSNNRQFIAERTKVCNKYHGLKLD